MGDLGALPRNSDSISEGGNPRFTTKPGDFVGLQFENTPSYPVSLSTLAAV